ncbi:MAG TPA: maleylpyruvate isomerase family mycothiol-dependent enzyme, partial [Mycobacterium sp.]|nr:maleylpyruvate isomerase family mycothiol-dependent enzyme [Mycobacterium sp.]
GPIAADVAAGAVDHAVDVMWGWMPEGASARSGDVVEFVAADTGAKWLVDVGTWVASDGQSAPRAVRATAGEPTATVSGSAEDLALWAWTRGGSVSISGDSAALAALLTQGIQ